MRQNLLGSTAIIFPQKIDFVAGVGYTVKNIEKTDYINCSPPFLFSERFVEKIGNQLSDEKNIPYWVVSEYFMDLCKENGLLIRFKEV